MMIVFIIVTVLIVAWALRAFGLGWLSSPDTSKHRFARREVDRAEYEDHRKLLSNS